MRDTDEVDMFQRVRLINGLAVALTLIWIVLIGATLTPNVDDFKQYWQAGRNFLTQGDIYTTTPEPGQPITAPSFPYPPLLAYLLLPLALLPLVTALRIWFVLNLLMLALLLIICIRVSRSVLARRYWGVVALAMVLAPPTRLSLQLGQVSILLTLLMVGGFALAPQRSRIAGGLLAIAGMIKLYPAFIGLFYIRHGPRLVAWWALGSASLIGIVGLALHGIQPYQAYVRKVLLGGFYPYAAEFNISLVGFWQRLLVPSTYAIALFNAPALAWVLAAGCSLIVLAGCIWVKRGASGQEAQLLRFCVYLCGMLLISPVNGIYNLIALLLPVLALVHCLEQQPNPALRRQLVIASTLACIPAGWSVGTPFYTMVHTGWGILLLSPALYGLLFFFGLLVWLVRQIASDQIGSA